MKLFKSFVRSAVVLLLCVSLFAGILLPVQAIANSTMEDSDTAGLFSAGATTKQPSEPTVLTVYEQTEGAEAVGVKTYTAGELDALKTSGTAAYQFWKSGNESIVVATEYVTIASLLSDAGLEFADGDKLVASDPTNFTSTLTYTDSTTYKYYGTESGMNEVPAALALCWGSGTGSVEEVAATAINSGSIRFCYGISGQQYTDKSAAGKRLASKINSITIIHPEKAELSLKDFVDAPKETNWAYAGLEFAVREGLMNGVGNNRLDPEGTMSRAMFVTVLWRYMDEPKEGENIFEDVNVQEGKWYIDAVAWAAKNSIIYGTGNGKFEPDGCITREQIISILYRFAQKQGISVEKRGDVGGFDDASKVSEYAKDAMIWAVGEGILCGSDGKLLPQDNATRAESATILMRFIQNCKNK